MTDPDTLVAGARLSRARYAAADGRSIDLPSGRGPLVLLVMHSAECVECARYLSALLAGADRTAWGARVFGIVRDASGASADRVTGRGAILVDRARALAAGAARLIVADEWGEVHFACAAGADHRMPGVDEVLEWVRFIAIQCPECEGPEGEWRTL